GRWLDAHGMSDDLFGQSEPFLGTWPTSVSMRKGSLYPPPKPALRTVANEFSSLPGLLPTPAAGNFNDGESPESWEARRQANLAKGINGNGQGTPLAIAVKLLPTPMAGDANGTRNATADRKKDNPNVPLGWTLSDVVYDGRLSNPPASPAD